MTRLRARMMRRFRLRRDRAGFTLIELLVGMIVIATAAVGTTIAFYSAYGSLAEQRHRMRANDLLRAEMEKWTGRIHIASVFPGPRELQQPTQWEEVLIDPRGPGDADDIWGEVRRQAIVPVDEVDTPQNPDYYELSILIRWWEPAKVPGESAVQVTQELTSFWLKSQ